MGQSTDGQLCYGIMFPEGFEFPWEEIGEDDWWKQQNNYKPLFEMFDKEGNWLDGKEASEAEKKKYYAFELKWEKENPLPIDIVNYCSGDYPMYILAVKESCKKNHRGYPEEVKIEELKVTKEQEQNLINFCEKYLKDQIKEYNDEEYNKEKIELKPKWYLSSYWG